MELSSGELIRCNKDCSEIIAADDIGDSLEPGTVIVLDGSSAGIKTARVVERKDSDGRLSLAPVELDRVAEVDCEAGADTEGVGNRNHGYGA